MSLYAALETILVDEGPLDGLYALRLPAGQVGPVDVVCVLQGGVGAERYLGSAPVVDGPQGVRDDGGVLWHRTTVQFQVRGGDPADPSAVVEVADWIRDVLIQYAGGSVFRGGEEIVRVDLTSAPAYYGQDEQERPLMAVSFEVWHRPV